MCVGLQQEIVSSLVVGPEVLFHEAQIMRNAISCNLTENALDYLILAGEQVQAGGHRMSKHAVATLADGVELLLKARIEQRDWCLIFKDVDKATQQSYESGDFVSITFDQAVKRLLDRCDVEIRVEHREIINDLRQLRNRIRHFAVTMDEEFAISLIAKTFSFALEFQSQHLPHAGEDFPDELSQLRELLGRFDQFIDERFEQIQPAIDAHFSSAIDCPSCMQKALLIEGDKTRCLFCKSEFDGADAASEWSSRFLPFQSLKDSLIDPQIRTCPECYEEACVYVSQHTENDTGYVCFNCGIEGNYEECSSCGELANLDGLSVFGECMSNMMGDD